MRLEQGILASADLRAQKIILPRLKAVIAEFETLFAAAEAHSCNYKIGHPNVTNPCPLCLLIKQLKPE